MLKCTMDERLSRNKPYSYAKPDMLTLMWQTAEALNYNDRLAEIIGMTPLLLKYEEKPITDLDPATGTGRFLLEASLMYPKLPLLLYGVEIDVSLYRACLVNMAMFSNHPYSIICADTLMLDPQYSLVGGKVWELGNQWDPPDITPYYFKMVPPFKFSLANLAKEQKEQPQLEQPMIMAPTAFSLAEMVKAKKVVRNASL